MWNLHFRKPGLNKTKNVIIDDKITTPTIEKLFGMLQSNCGDSRGGTAKSKISIAKKTSEWWVMTSNWCCLCSVEKMKISRSSASNFVFLPLWNRQSMLHFEKKATHLWHKHKLWMKVCPMKRQRSKQGEETTWPWLIWHEHSRLGKTTVWLVKPRQLIGLVEWCMKLWRMSGTCTSPETMSQKPNFAKIWKSKWKEKMSKTNFGTSSCNSKSVQVWHKKNHQVAKDCCNFESRPVEHTTFLISQQEKWGTALEWFYLRAVMTKQHKTSARAKVATAMTKKWK